ncbi:MAG: type II secretion system F family protein [Nocardioides sp.]
MWGALVGLTTGLGLLLIGQRLSVIRQPQLSVRVLPYVRDVPRLEDRMSTGRRTPAATTGAAVGVFGPALRAGAEGVERLLGGATSVRRRLERAGLDPSVHEFRIEQVVWGLVAFAATAVVGALRALSGPTNPWASLLLCAMAFAIGVVARDNWLSSQVKARERRILQEFPTIAELLALAVAAGESPVSALDRVVRRSGGELSGDLGRVLAAIRTGEPLTTAFDKLAGTTGLPLVSRFAQGIAIATERGTPLAEVLHAQAADVREAGRRDLIELAARREVVMMVPVVFLILPVTVLFAFWPGLLGLSLTAP